MWEPYPVGADLVPAENKVEERLAVHKRPRAAAQMALPLTAWTSRLCYVAKIYTAHYNSRVAWAAGKLDRWAACVFLAISYSSCCDENI